MATTLADRPLIKLDAIPTPLWHGTNRGDLIRASSIRASNADAGGRGISNLIWFFADYDAAENYCIPTAQDGPDGWGPPEIFLYKYIGTRPICDFRGLERQIVLEVSGGRSLKEALDEAGYGGVLIHSTTQGEHDEWGFVASSDLQYGESRTPCENWFTLKKQQEAEHERFVALSREKREQEARLREMLEELHRLKQK